MVSGSLVAEESCKLESAPPAAVISRVFDLVEVILRGSRPATFCAIISSLRSRHMERYRTLCASSRAA